MSDWCIKFTDLCRGVEQVELFTRALSCSQCCAGRPTSKRESRKTDKETGKE